ncbi:MAG TPA: hypothetical protein VMM82_13565, partial [Spirochaetia bacterium]|nr:hypothetical protein [Spirochaetia bacterium]
LNYKSQTPILVSNAPDSFGAELGAMEEAEIHSKPKKGMTYGFALAFAVMKADLVKAANDMKPFTGDETVLWFAYPKQTSKAFRSDLNRDLCAAALAPLGLQPVRQIAIDEDWSALRYTRTSS